jgi:hypothetical protein
MRPRTEVLAAAKPSQDFFQSLAIVNLPACVYK